MSTNQHRLQGALAGICALGVAVLAFLAGCQGEGPTGPGSEPFGNATEGLTPPGSQKNYALQLDGVNDAIDLSAGPLGAPASLTVEAWVRLDAADKIHFLVANAANDFNDGFWLLINPDSKVAFGAAAGFTTKSGATGTTVLEPGQWYHVAGSYDAEKDLLKVFVNGVEEASADYAAGIRYDGGRDLQFGTQVKWSRRSERHLKGAIDEVRIWDTARDAESITADRDVEIAGDREHLIGYWRMNEGDGTVTAAETADENPGSLVSDPIWIEAGWPVVVPLEVLEVAIDIRPDDTPNVIQLNSRGVIPVALLSSAELDVTTEVDRGSLTFGPTGDEPSLHRRGNGDPNCGVEDVNGDGLSDLVCKFSTQASAFQPRDTEGILKGLTGDERPLEGRDQVQVKQGGRR